MPEKNLTDYEKYIRTEELLALQKPLSVCANEEEPLFQTMHQAAELWMKHLLLEVGRICRFLDADQGWEATHLFHRVSLVWSLLARQIEITETLAPADYHKIRVTSLGRGSGNQSPGFNRLLEVPPDLWKSFSAFLVRRKLSAGEVMRKPHEHQEAFRVLQGMLEYDELFQKWRYTHLKLVERVIGLRVKSLQDVPATALIPGTQSHLFPELWELVPNLTDEWRPGY
jgi:tryptophan 2,3-dioxygenase